MIQRIQTIYLFIVAVFSGIGSFLIPEWDFLDQELLIEFNSSQVAIAYLIIAVLALFSIFIFKNRRRQMAFVKINGLLNLALLGCFVYWFLSLPGENNVSDLFSKKGIGILIPIISIVFLRLAYKAIKKDDDLVKSVNRLR